MFLIEASLAPRISFFELPKGFSSHITLAQQLIRKLVAKKRVS
jgi:hypothetical protein